MVYDWLIARVGDGKSIIFDGLPRTMTQAKELHQLFNTFVSPIRTHVIQLKIDDAMIVERVKTRAICQNKECQAVHSLHEHSPQRPQKDMICNDCSAPLMRRLEDEVHVLKERLAIYHDHESEILKFYGDVRQEVDILRADEPLERVYEQLLSLVGLAR